MPVRPIAVNAEETVATTPVAEETVKAPKAASTKVDHREELVNKALPNLSQEQIAQFGSKSGTLSFVRALGFESETSTYTDRAGVAHSCAEVVGAVFVSTEPIKVPRLPITTSPQTGINKDDITYEDVAAGVEFEVTMMEAAVLLTQEEYSARFLFNGEPRGQFSAKFTALSSGAKFPTPHFLIKEYQYKANSEVIDVKQADGSYTIKPGFERYAELLNKPRASRGGSSKSSGNKLQKSDKTALAIRQLIFG